MTQNVVARCPCCDDDAPQLLGRLQDAQQFAGAETRQRIAGGSLYRCTECRLKFRYPIESDARYAELYDHGAADNWSGGIPRPDWDLIVQHLENQDTDARRVLDFGCNTGGLLARLTNTTKKFGVEINKAAADIATNDHGITVWRTIESIPPEARFDTIVAVDVVEHVRNPADLVTALLGRLTPDGELIVTTGDGENKWWDRFGANWWYCFHPEHIAFVSASWLDYLARRSNIDVVECSLFRYRDLGAVTRIMHTTFMFFYGVTPRAYLSLRNMLSRLLSKPQVSSVLGNGVSADHLFIVLKNRVTHEQ